MAPRRAPALVSVALAALFATAQAISPFYQVVRSVYDTELNRGYDQVPDSDTVSEHLELLARGCADQEGSASADAPELIALELPASATEHECAAEATVHHVPLNNEQPCACQSDDHLDPGHPTEHFHPEEATCDHLEHDPIAQGHDSKDPISYDHLQDPLFHEPLSHDPIVQVPIPPDHISHEHIVLDDVPHEYVSQEHDSHKVVPHAITPPQNSLHEHISHEHICLEDIPHEHISHEQVTHEHISHENIPHEHIPHEHVPHEHVPHEHLPQEHISHEHIPQEHIPHEHISHEQVTHEQISHENIPHEHIPHEHVPHEHVPHEHLPQEHISHEHIPQEHIPHEHISHEYISHEHISQEHFIHDLTPHEHIPQKHICHEHIPHEQIPHEHVLREHILHDHDLHGHSECKHEKISALSDLPPLLVAEALYRSREIVPLPDPSCESDLDSKETEAVVVVQYNQKSVRSSEEFPVMHQEEKKSVANKRSPSLVPTRSNTQPGRVGLVNVVRSSPESVKKKPVQDIGSSSSSSSSSESSSSEETSSSSSSSSSESHSSESTEKHLHRRRCRRKPNCRGSKCMRRRKQHKKQPS